MRESNERVTESVMNERNGRYLVKKAPKEREQVGYGGMTAPWTSYAQSERSPKDAIVKHEEGEKNLAPG